MNNDIRWSLKKCRVCGLKLADPPLLSYINMPKAAQFLPDVFSLEKDHGIDLIVCQCSGCGLIQLFNDPVAYYREVVRASAFSDEMRDFRVAQFSRIVRQFQLEGKRVIEIGCGCGEYLSILQQQGVEPYGLEYSVESVEYCAKAGLDVSKGFVDSRDCRLGHAPFDAFVMLNFLEHLPEPVETLSGISGNLADDGVGLVEVPNFDMILHNKLFSEFTSDHLCYFTRDTLSLALSMSGFEVIECNEEWHRYIISALVRKRRKLDASSFQNQQARVTDELKEYISRFGPKSVAIWGAGHQAFSVMAFMEIGDKVKFVLDSASFKQGRFTPATHIPIVSPDTLNSDPVDAVIIMAAGYSDEVLRTMQQKFPGISNVAVLRDYGLELVK